MKRRHLRLIKDGYRFIGISLSRPHFSTRSFREKSSRAVRDKIKCRVIGCKNNGFSVSGHGVKGSRRIRYIASLLSLWVFWVFYTLFVGLDVADLATVGTLPLGARWLSSSRSSGFIGRFSIGLRGNSFLFLASEAAFFISVESTKFGFESRKRKLAADKSIGRREILYSFLLRASTSGSPVGSILSSLLKSQ